MKDLFKKYLSSLLNKKCALYLINSIRLVGSIEQFDNECILIKTNGDNTQLVFIKHIVQIHPSIFSEVNFNI